MQIIIVLTVIFLKDHLSLTANLYVHDHKLNQNVSDKYKSEVR